LTLGIYAPTFTLSSVGNADIGQGTSGTWNVEVFPEYGFTGSVAFPYPPAERGNRIL